MRTTLKTCQRKTLFTSTILFPVTLRYDAVEQTKPWKKDPNYFTNVKISALALIKMVMHARSGGQIEIMGIMQGKVVGTFGFLEGRPHVNHG